jgi:hypothetical protein
MSNANARFSVNGDGKQPIQSAPNPRKKQLADALGKRFSELNVLWQNAEDDLKKIPIPVDVPICYKSVDTDDDPVRRGPQIHSYLGFAKAKGGWRICIGHSHDSFPEMGIDWKPITECTVDFRLEAVPHINKLRQAVLKAAEDCLPNLDNAIAELRSTLASW